MANAAPADAGVPTETDQAATAVTTTTTTPPDRRSITTPQSSVASEYFDYDLFDSCTRSVPEPGKTFIIRSAACGRVLTWTDGRATLAPPGERGNFVWDCVESEGWLGFRNPSTLLYLGHTGGEGLTCKSKAHNAWEFFITQPRADGSFVLLTEYWGKLRRVGLKAEGGRDKRLVRLLGGESDGLAWEFFEKA